MVKQATPENQCSLNWRTMLQTELLLILAKWKLQGDLVSVCMIGLSIILVTVLPWKTSLLFVHLAAMWSRVIFQSQISSHSQRDAVPIMLKSKHKLTLPETVAIFSLFLSHSFARALSLFFALSLSLFLSSIFKIGACKEYPSNARKNALFQQAKPKLPVFQGVSFTSSLTLSPLLPQWLARFPELKMLVGFLYVED